VDAKPIKADKMPLIHRKKHGHQEDGDADREKEQHEQEERKSKSLPRNTPWCPS
jgi:hypothetical protein